MKAAESSKASSRLTCYRVRLRGLPATLGTDLLFEKIITCFKRHQRNLYDAPDFILCDLVRFGHNLDLLIETSCKQLLLKRLGKLSLPVASIRCRPLNPQNWTSGHGFAAWLVQQYGLDSADPGRRRLRTAQRRPVGNNYTYHVWNRTAHRCLLFGPTEKDLILQIVIDACRHARVQLHAFVVLGNHFHLVVTTQNDVSISELMQHIDWQISTCYNKLHQTSGTLWQGPFKHALYEPTASNLLGLIHYVHANPLRAGLATEPAAYAWSSYAHYSGTRRRKALVVPLAIRRRWPRRQARQASYREHFAHCYRSGKLRSDPAMSRAEIVGSSKFVKAVTDNLAGPARLPAFLQGVLKLQRQNVVWGLKTLLHLLCQPLVDAWLVGQQRWKELADRIEPLLPPAPVPG